MDRYVIIITPDASDDLWQLRDYIADVLLSPDIALSYIQTIRNEINNLSELPGRIKSIDSEPWHSIGIRRISAKNFYVYYRVDEKKKRVYILNVIYAKRDQLKQLARMKWNDT